MRIAIAGATGFIGQGLTRLLLRKGEEPMILSRNPAEARQMFQDKVRAFKWTPDNVGELSRELHGIDAIINLSGENIGSSLWTSRKRAKILESRLSAGRLVTEVIRSLKRKPDLLVQASAVGFYGSQGEAPLDEAASAGEGFLADVVRQWEDSTAGVDSLGVRRIIIRSGVVLASHGGAFPKLAMPYKLLAGTILGSGSQWVPWIHYEDELEAIYFLLNQKFSSGIYNLVSPNPAQMREIGNAIAEAMRRPTIMRIPDFALKLAMGRMAEETILTSQKVVPARLAGAGFGFRHAGLKSSVAGILSDTRGEID